MPNQFKVTYQVINLISAAVERTLTATVTAQDLNEAAFRVGNDVLDAGKTYRILDIVEIVAEVQNAEQEHSNTSAD